MSDVLAFPSATLDAAGADASGVRLLSVAARGERGVIIRVAGRIGAEDAAEADELERRLLEAGFVEGARVTLLHEGPMGGDPIAVRLDDMRVALRRREAHGVLVQLDAVS